jgi:hypothetical protein
LDQRIKYFRVIAFLLLLTLRFQAQTDSTINVTDSLPVSAPEFISADSTDHSHEVEQVSESVPTVEEISYNLYLSKEWQKLAAYCQKTADEGTDYYYLRLRAGIAYFEMQKYRAAAEQFQRAIEFNSEEDLAKEYLYYSYLYTERVEEARKLTRSFSAALSEKLQSNKKSPLISVLMESGFKRTEHPSFQNALFTQAGLSHSVFRRLSLFHLVNYFDQKEARFKVQQMQYYLRAIVPLKNNIQISVAGHFIKINEDISQLVTVNTTGTIQSQPPPPGAPPPPPTQTVNIKTTREVFTPQQSFSSVFALSVTKQSKLASASFGLLTASLDTAMQFQANAGLVLYPLLHNRFYIGANVYFHSENKSAFSRALSPYMTVRPFKCLYVNVTYFMNGGNNISEYNAYLFTNSIDYTRQRWTATVSLGLSSNVWLFGTYGYEVKQHLTKEFKYDYQIFSAGFKILSN